MSNDPTNPNPDDYEPIPEPPEQLKRHFRGTLDTRVAYGNIAREDGEIILYSGTEDEEE
jgi:hypothetical protein